MIRTLYDLALKAGRKFQSEQTHLLHWHPSANAGTEQHTIPILENFLFVLALLRSRVTDNLSEGKALLERLLAFQNPEGNFPLYLHEFPLAHDRFLAIRLLPIFFWIDREFSGIMKPELRQLFSQKHQLLMGYAEKIHREQPLPYPWDLVFAGAATKPDFAYILSASEEKEAWWRTEGISWILIALQMTSAEWERGRWSIFWEHVGHSWHTRAMVYTGPSFQEWQEGLEPELTPYDLWMGLFQGELSHRALTLSITHLWGALMRPVLSPCPFLKEAYTLEGDWKGGAWRVFVDPFFASSFIEKRKPLPPSEGKGFAPFRLVWGSQEHTHSLVMQGDRNEAVTWKKAGGAGQLLLSLSKEVETEDKKKNREVLFFVDHSPGVHILVEGKYATTFAIEQNVTVQGGGLRTSLQFFLEEGQGDFVGHIMPGNRPSQIGLKPEKGFQAHDWQIFLRTLRRTPECKIRVELTYVKI